MDPFRPAPRGIPLAEAAAYFIGLKKLAGYEIEPDDVDYDGLGGEEEPEPATKEAADRSDAEQVEVGRQRAIANASAGFTTDSLNRGERLGDLFGRLIGGGLGVHAGNPGGSGPAAMAVRLGAGAVGQHVGGRVGKAVGQELDGYTFRQKQWKELPEDPFPKTANCAADEVARLSKAPRIAGAGDFQPFGRVPEAPKGRLVAGNLKAESSVDRQGNRAPAPGPFPGLQLGADALSEGSFDDLAGVSSRDPAFTEAAARFKQAAQDMGLLPPDAPEDEGALDAAQTQNELDFYSQRFQQAAQEMGLLQQQNEQLQAQVEEMQSTQQAALDQATMVQQQAMQNQQAAHEAASNAMQQTMQAQQEALATKQEAMATRDHLQGIKQTLVDIASQIPDVGGLPTLPQPGAAQDPAAVGGQPPGPQPQASPLPNAPEPPPPEQPPQQGGGQSGDGGGSSEGGGKSEGGDGGKLSIKVGNAQLLGALGGAAIGGAGTAIESRMPVDGLRGKVQQLEERERGGGSSFLDAVNLAQSKFRLGLREAAQAHPGAATAAGAALGAMTGMRAAPAVQSLLE